MTEQLSDDEKYQYIKDTYDKDADKILSKYGALAYDIDKYLAKKSKGIPKDIRNDDFSAKLILIELGMSPYMLDKAKKEYDDTKKVAAIRAKYGKKAEAILAAYGPMAKDIDDNFNKYYGKIVPFGRNYWLNQKGLQKRGEEGKKNKALFEAGKLPLDEAARIVNCPAYFGSMSSTIKKISAEIKQSAVTYQARNNPAKPVSKPKGKTVQESAPQQQTEQEKAKTDKTSAVKDEMKKQRKVAEMKPNVVTLDELVVTAQAPKKSPHVDAIIKLDKKLDTPKLAEIKIKSPAEKQYDEMVAKKMKKMPDELMGKKGEEIGLTIGELMKLGVDPKVDFQTILKNMKESDRAAAEALIPKGGFKDKKAVVSKELAIKAIALSQYRNAQKNHGKQRA